jgi:hypothetical protein
MQQYFCIIVSYNDEKHQIRRDKHCASIKTEIVYEVLRKKVENLLDNDK